MISWASFPEIVWWNREASWHQASWHPQQHFMIFGTHEKQAKLPPQMAVSLLLIRSSVCDSGINIFIGSSKFQLDLLWTGTLPASVGSHFFHFYMGLANGSWCWKSSPQATGIALSKVKLLHPSVSCSSQNIYQRKRNELCNGKVTQILTWRTNNFLALVSICLPLVLVLGSLNSSFKIRKWFQRGTSYCLLIKILCL